MCCPLVFEFSVRIGGFVIGLGQISFFFSLHEQWYTTENGSHVFCSWSLSKTGYWLGVYHGWSLAWAYSTCEDHEPIITEMKNSCPHWDLNQGSFASEANGSVLAKGCAISWDIWRALKYWPSFTWVFNLYYLYHVVDVAKWFFLYFCHIIFVFFAVCFIKTFADCKELIKCNTRQNILLHLPRGTRQ